MSTCALLFIFLIRNILGNNGKEDVRGKSRSDSNTGKALLSHLPGIRKESKWPQSLTLKNPMKNVLYSILWPLWLSWLDLAPDSALKGYVSYIYKVHTRLTN